MNSLVIAMVSGGGITALGVCVAAYYYGVKTGRALERDIILGKVAHMNADMYKELIKEMTATDVQNKLNTGEF